jgi:hypothetical protein
VPDTGKMMGDIFTIKEPVVRNQDRAEGRNKKLSKMQAGWPTNEQAIDADDCIVSGVQVYSLPSVQSRVESDHTSR